ncbi:RIB43A-domain-containing protein [Entophlyctis helioformis]|nr:RIB43A-domain-containing protein [Entophlyctis helioformis]
MYKVEVLSDNLQAAAIQRRRRLDEERKQRIFNPKVRVMGIDLQALDEQIQIKNEIKANDKKRNDVMDAKMKHTNEILQFMDNEVALARRHQHQEMNRFRVDYQKPPQRRDFDLYDPNALRKDLPARTSDDDNRIGVSSLQRFEGEDLADYERHKLQKDQMRVWANEQVYEKERRQQEEMDEKKKYEELERNMNNKMMALQHAVDQARRERAIYDNEYNLALADEKRRREQLQKAYETDLNTREILNHINGVFLTETPDVFNIGGGHKVRVDLFKGITPEQKQAILNVQEKQRAEQQQRRQAKQHEEDRWALQEAANARALTLLERERERNAKNKAVQIRKENETKALEDKARQYYIDKVLYTNPPKDSYFEQFNTTSR